ncbi:MAG: sulfotransferase [bacterium]|nr:sulfotransferase [bacterium]
MAERDYLTIVSGLPRSGTSLTMQMIADGGVPPLIDHVRTADEDNPKGYYEFELVKKTKEDSSWVSSGVGKVVKMVHLLLLDLPLDHCYRVVFTRRHLDEVIKSQDVMLMRKGKAKGETSEKDRERIKTFYRMQIHKVQEHMRAHADHFQFIEIDYNAIIQEPAPHVEQMSTFLDGLDTPKMMAVVDPTLYRNRSSS